MILHYQTFSIVRSCILDSSLLISNRRWCDSDVYVVEEKVYILFDYAS